MKVLGNVIEKAVGSFDFGRLSRIFFDWYVYILQSVRRSTTMVCLNISEDDYFRYFADWCIGC